VDRGQSLAVCAKALDPQHITLANSIVWTLTVCQTSSLSFLAVNGYSIPSSMGSRYQQASRWAVMWMYAIGQSVVEWRPAMIGSSGASPPWPSVLVTYSISVVSPPAGSPYAATASGWRLYTASLVSLTLLSNLDFDFENLRTWP
jgi:hypothetical protein